MTPGTDRGGAEQHSPSGGEGSGVLKPGPHPHHYLEPGFGHSRHSQAGGMAEGGEEQRWVAKGLQTPGWQLGLSKGHQR